MAESEWTELLIDASQNEATKDLQEKLREAAPDIEVHIGQGPEIIITARHAVTLSPGSPASPARASPQPVLG